VNPSAPAPSSIAATPKTLLEGVADGVHVFVDVSGIGRVGYASPYVWASLGLVVVCLIAAVVGTTARVRPALGLALLGGALGAAVSYAVASVHGVYLTSLVPSLLQTFRRGDDAVLAAGGAVGVAVVAVVVAVVGLVVSARSFDGADVVLRRRIACGIAVVVGVAGVIVGGIAVVKVTRARDAVAAPLRAAWPLPTFAFPGQVEGTGPLPEVHVGRTRHLAPENLAQWPALWSSQSLSATLSATSPGEHVAIFEASAGPVRIRQNVRFVAVADRGPAGMAFRPGHRQAWVEVSGRGGVVSQSAKRLRGLKKKPAPDIVLVVLDEREVDGLRVMRMQLTDAGGSRIIDVVARDGQLVRVGGGVVLAETDGGCQASLLGFSSCTCTSAGITSCADRSGNAVGSFVRMGLALVTLGLSEVTGACRDCDATTERGVVLVSSSP
jgi:hypothetical protein